MTDATEPHDALADLQERLDALHRSDLKRWAAAASEAQHLQAEVTAMRATVSWRITAPLRLFRARQLDNK